MDVLLFHARMNPHHRRPRRSKPDSNENVPPSTPPPPPQPPQRHPSTSVMMYDHDPRTTPSSQALIVTWLMGVLTFVAVYFWIFAPKQQSQPPPPQYQGGRQAPPQDVTKNGTTPAVVVVIAWQAPPKDWPVWTAQRLKEYENECHRLLEDYSRLIETVASSSSYDNLAAMQRYLQDTWQRDLQRIEHYAQLQQAALASILERPFTYRLALPSTTQPSHSSWFDGATNSSLFDNATTMTQQKRDESSSHQPIRLPPTYVPDTSYDSVRQMLAHLVRDWSDEGHNIRTSLYDWCHQQIPDTASRILVPGAGLGRLAWELATNNDAPTARTVHAVEISWTMVAVFVSLVEQPTQQTWTIYPYLNDFWTNQVTTETRFRALQIPNVPVRATPRLTWTIANFVDFAAVPQEAASYDCIVTCFFLDTATNVLEYMHAMERLLVSGGRWVNVGPLHWHSNARIVLTAQDLYALFRVSGLWKTVSWSIDTEPVEYRSVTTSGNINEATSTRYEAYRPLRFVVQKT